MNKNFKLKNIKVISKSSKEFAAKLKISICISKIIKIKFLKNFCYLK